MSDVRISCHIAKSQPSGNKEFVIIRFYEGLQNLIGTDYVILSVKDDRLYFLPTQVRVKGSLKLTDIVNVWKQAPKIKSFEGEYTLAYDIDKELYYVDRNSKSDLTRMYGNNNVPHIKYKSHTNPPYEEIEMTKAPETNVYEVMLDILKTKIEEKNKVEACAILDAIKVLLNSNM